MPLVKDVLWTGRWQYPNEVLRLNSTDVVGAVRNANKMLSSGLAVKLCWEHQPNAVPKPASQWAKELADPAKAATWAKSIIADAVDFHVGRDAVGKPVVQAVIDDSKMSEDERKQIERAGKVSCRLDHNLQDPSTGVRYPGWSISHIAVTPKPVQSRQGPFIQMSKSDWPSDRTVYMGEGNPMADEFDDKKKSKPSDDAPPETEPEGDDDSPSEESAPVEQQQGPTGNRAKLMRLMGVLNAGWGINIPETVTDFDSLILSLETLAANPADAGGDPNAIDPNAPDATTPAPGGSMPMMMSAVEMAKKHPRKVQNDRDELRAEIKALVRVGQIPAYLGQEWLDKAGSKTFAMSYTAGDHSLVRDGLFAAVDAIRENVIKGTFLARKGAKNMSAVGRTAEVDAPAHLNRTDTTPTDLSEQMKRIAEARNRPTAKS